MQRKCGADVSSWYSPIPEDLAIRRLTLMFGLRSAWNYHRELVVPNLGSARFVRQMSWACSAIQIYQDLIPSLENGVTKSKISHAIEALGCKAHWIANRGERDWRVLGSRAFGRDPQNRITAASQLSQPSYYVRNTWRQRTTASLLGLGFTSGFRFNRFNLEPAGEELANYTLADQKWNGRTHFQTWLRQWLVGDIDIGESDWNVLRSCVGPAKPQRVERDLVRRRVLARCGPSIIDLVSVLPQLFKGDDLRAVAQVVQILDKNNLGKVAEAVSAGHALGQLINNCRSSLRVLVDLVREDRQGKTLDQLSASKGLSSSLKSLRAASEQYLNLRKMSSISLNSDALLFANDLSQSSDKTVVYLLAEKSDGVLAPFAERVIQGSNFGLMIRGQDTDTDDESESPITSEYIGDPATERLKQLSTLMSDCQGRGA